MSAFTFVRTVLIAGFLTFGALHSATPASPTSQQTLADALVKVASLFAVDASERSTITASITLAAGPAVPTELSAQPFEVAFQPPDRLRVTAHLGDEVFEIGRNGQQLWIWQPKKNFGVIGAQGVPRFSIRPENLDATQLDPLALPLPREQLALAPLLFRCESRPEEILDGVPCRVIRATLSPEAQTLLRADPFTLSLAVRDSDSFPARIGFGNGENPEVSFLIKNLKVNPPWPEEKWKLDPPAGAKIERVALGHLKRFFPAAIAMLTTHVNSLGPATGEVKLVATHGQGRLEMHDGTRVLFLKGTPEEMGEQHGKLLKREVKQLVNRVLYGVGVGSSFEKGRWFFSEIEACQSRLAKFIDPRSLREMDALAQATGLDPQEIRLANFFPEMFHCSGFALFGAATDGGRIYHGRILDYMKGIGLEPNAVVIVSQPDRGHAWVNVSYAGFVGSVTAMNEKGISIGEMGGRGEGNWDGKPMAQLLREVMENAATLDEAIDIMRRGPRTCEYYYVIADGIRQSAVGIAATPTTFEIIRPGVPHPQLPHAIPGAVLMSAGERYEELARRVEAGKGRFNAASARDLMKRPVCMNSNIHSVLFAPDTLDFWVANADSANVASHCRYTHYNLARLLKLPARER